ncbi:hypothetical protein ACOMHN_002811 [Nucella lapillus]
MAIAMFTHTSLAMAMFTHTSLAMAMFTHTSLAMAMFTHTSLAMAMFTHTSLAMAMFTHTSLAMAIQQITYGGYRTALTYCQRQDAAFHCSPQMTLTRFWCGTVEGSKGRKSFYGNVKKS